MEIRRLNVERFRGIEQSTIFPGRRTVLIGPNNAGKSTLLEAIDLVLHPGLGRPRIAPDESDYFGRDPSTGFSIEIVLGGLDTEFRSEVYDHLEGWDPAEREVVAEPDQEDCEPIVRVRVVGSPDFDLIHEFAKPESNGARFGPRLRRQVGWFLDARARDPAWQMVFHRGGVLDRLFAGVDLDPALEHLRAGLREGASGFTAESAVQAVLKLLSEDLSGLRVLERDGSPSFESGSVSEREMLQTLRLALPVLDDTLIPLSKQGRGVQRLVLVSSLLRLANKDGSSPIGGFEEPEEALEPVRQAQVAAMIADLAERGGQVFVVTHSPDIVRTFAVDDLHVVAPTPRGRALSLRDGLTERAKQGYERRLDGPVVQALFARVPVLVEGPSDRACFGVFWESLASAGLIEHRYAHALDFVNCESGSHQPEVARLLHEAGKRVVAWAETDTPRELARLRDEGNCSALVVYTEHPDRQNLEAELSMSCSLDALAAGLTKIAEIRGYTWDEQRADLLSRAGADTSVEVRAAMAGAVSVKTLLEEMNELSARRLVRSALQSKSVAPFEMKGGRPARLFAESVVAIDGVPKSFAAAMRALHEWIVADAPEAAPEFRVEVACDEI